MKNRYLALVGGRPLAQASVAARGAKYESASRSWVPMFDDFVLPPDTRWELHAAESQDAINGLDLLAKVRGPFFLVAAAARTERWYSRGLWERPLSECA